MINEISVCEKYRLQTAHVFKISYLHNVDVDADSVEQLKREVRDLEKVSLKGATSYVS